MFLLNYPQRQQLCVNVCVLAHMNLCEYMFYYYVCTPPGDILRNRSFLLMIAAPSGQNKNAVCYKYLLA